MTRNTSLFAALAALILAVPAIAHQGHQMPGEKVVRKTVTGEVVDMGCWLGHAAKGEKYLEQRQRQARRTAEERRTHGGPGARGVRAP